jgi:hypothetical protein
MSKKDDKQRERCVRRYARRIMSQQCNRQPVPCCDDAAAVSNLNIGGTSYSPCDALHLNYYSEESCV